MAADKLQINAAYVYNNIIVCTKLYNSNCTCINIDDMSLY